MGSYNLIQIVCYSLTNIYIEKVQRRATRMIEGFRKLSYDERYALILVILVLSMGPFNYYVTLSRIDQVCHFMTDGRGSAERYKTRLKFYRCI